MSNQSQKHGFTFENYIRKYIFNLPEKSNDTSIHDICKEHNCYNNNENCSIKTTKSNIIYCSDILRFYNYNFDEKNTIIVVQYLQIENRKHVKHIYEINYNKECHELLFGNLPLCEIEKYVNNVKSIPKNINGDKAKSIFNYLEEKDKLNEKYNFKININPKIDSKNQRRVQCSINNFENVLQKFITYKSTTTEPNILRKKPILPFINSATRKRN
jgi:hypothetical protein